MIAIEKLNVVTEIIVHENCADGVASAMYLHDVLPNANIRFVQYGTEEHKNLEPKPGMLFCDFSPHPSRYQEFVDAGAIVLDHHATAKPIVEAFGSNGVFGDETLHPGVCGAWLAHREVWLKYKAMTHQSEDIARLTGIRDTWQNKDSRWKEACILAEAFKFFPVQSWLDLKDPFEDDLKDSLTWWESRIETGAILVQKTAERVQRALAGGYHFTTSKGTRVIMFEGTTLSSDAAEAADQTADLIVGFDYMGLESSVASLVFSTRSHTTFDCATFCKLNGGGGHTKAAGFPVKFDLAVQSTQDPYSTLELLLAQFEAQDPPPAQVDAASNE